MSDTNFDVIIIGSGPGGYVTAIRSSQLGFKTAIIEKDSLGGVCLNWGCIPTKALLRSGGIKHLLSKNNVKIIDGFASLQPGKAAPEVHVEGKIYNAKHVILATGARARTIPQAGLEPDGKYIWSAKEAMIPDTMPNKLLVIGSGAIGMEFASFYNAFGSKVTVVEMEDRILPAEDEEISVLAKKAFSKRGIEIITNSKATLKVVENGVEAVLENISESNTKTYDRVILAIGIVGNTENIGLEKLGVKVNKNHISINEFSQTGIKGLYAIGDVTTPPWLAHKASHEGIICIEKIAGRNPEPLNPISIPGCTYCHPQIASVGYTEKQAIKAGFTIKVGKFPFVGNGKAIALGEPEGLIKTIFDEETGELLGAHMIGAEVTELIQGYTIAQKLETTEHELMETVFPHPTLSEMMHEAVLDAYNRTIHF